MKIQFRTLTIKERRELYKQALDYFQFGELRYLTGVCEYASCYFYLQQLGISRYEYQIWGVLRSQDRLDIRPVAIGKELMPELWNRREHTPTKEDPYWFHDEVGRIAALKDCIASLDNLTEEEDEQGTTVIFEFELDI